MKRKSCSLIILLITHQLLVAQEKPVADTSTTLNEIVVTAFEQNRAISCGTIIKVLNFNNADRNNKTSLVNAFNAVAGVRMEERSPGSYRINIRGSSLRSPFGVRNVKVYWNSMPVTDAGGNTYFNQFAFNNFSYLEIVKGPAGSMYGAGTGGLILMHSFENYWKPGLNIEYVTGSYGLQNILSSVKFGEKNMRSIITLAHNEGNGYRNHTKIKKDNVSYVSRFKFSEKQQLTTSILYTNLFYETPGALTKTEFMANPKQARPAAGGLPSAATAKAAIYQKNFLAGINHQYNFNSNFNITTSLYSSFAQIKNPTFRNYERRIEPGFGGRTSFLYKKEINGYKIQIVTGAELQKGFFNTQVFKNKNGNADSLQTNDDIQYTTCNIFAQGDIDFKNNWIFTAGASINKSKVEFTRLSSYPVLQQSRTYTNELSPRLALQKKIKTNNAVFASISKGFSPPTISELLPSNSIISTFLEAEQGVNYEMGGKFSLLKNKLQIELTAYSFKLVNALVSRKDSSNADYFVNAGNSRQKGIELSLAYSTVFSHPFFDNLIIQSALTINNFKYGNFKKGTSDFTGKNLPGVPQNSFSIIADVNCKNEIYLNSTYYAASKIYLDDANTVTDDGYHLWGGRLGYIIPIKNKLKLKIYTGIDNILNETYSLGNDINATGGRYYNAAAKRNYYAGISIGWNYSDKK